MKKLLVFFIVISYTTLAQWQTNGNPPAGPGIGVFPPANNYLGGNSGNPNWIHLGTVGSSDIFIDNQAGQLFPPNFGGHWVGLGRIFNNTIRPSAHLHIQGASSGGAQTTGLRTWFQTGILCTEESDGMYVRLKI